MLSYMYMNYKFCSQLEKGKLLSYEEGAVNFFFEKSA